MVKWKGFPTRLSGLALLLSLAVPAAAQDTAGFEHEKARLLAQPGCRAEELDGNVTRIGCPSAFTLWYLTRPGHPAYPAILKRTMVRGAAGLHADVTGTHYGGDATAYRTWLAEVRGLDH
jgi:hypothetical protein